MQRSKVMLEKQLLELRLECLELMGSSGHHLQVQLATASQLPNELEVASTPADQADTTGVQLDHQAADEQP